MSVGAEWRTFVPDAAVGLLADLPAPLPVTRRTHAVVLFADLAGFTPLSEALAGLGPAGGEVMRALLNRHFGVLIERIAAAGGDVTSFAGDALTATFAYADDGPSRTRSAQRAARCALEMQRALSDLPAISTPRGQLRPGMKIGLAAGPVVHALVGDPTRRLLYVLAGDPLVQAAAAERRCGPGEVVGDETLAGPEARIEVAARRADFSVLAAAPPGPPEEPPPPPGSVDAPPRPEGNGPVDAAMAQLLHPVLAAQLDAGHGALVDEHRVVTTAFVGLPDMGVPADHGVRLQEYATAAVETIERYGGNLRQIDAGDKGYQLMLSFGTPRAHADDPERAVACCLDLMRLPGGPFRAGITTGSAYCGEVGTDWRRDYTVLGDTVNVAARLAHSAGPGQLLVDEGTAARMGSLLLQEHLPPFPVKGRDAPVEVRSVRGLREPELPLVAEPPVGAPMLGRHQEFAIARECLTRAKEGRGRILTVVGEPGIGKSRLVADIVRAARASGWGCYLGAGGSPADGRGYLAWRSIWRGLLAVPARSLDTERDLVRAAMTDAAGVVDERTPLLGPVLNIPLPDTPLTASLEPRTRAEITRGLLLELLRRRAAAEPVLLVLEDCHWIDESSRALVEFLAPHVADMAVLLLVVSREEPASVPLLRRLRALSHCTDVILPGLPRELATVLVRHRLRRLSGGAAVPDGVLERLVDLGGGNPFFLEELASYLHDREDRAGDTTALDLPGDVRRLVLARLDALEPREQEVVKAASVVGRSFRASWVSGSLPDAETYDEVAHCLDHLARLELIGVRDTAPELEYDFKHSITQAVAYETLGSGLRARLHEAVGRHIEETYPDRLAQYVDVLAHHYARSTNTDKQRTWLRAAGDAARTAYANDAALDYYRRLLPLLPDTDTAEVLVEVGTVRRLTGRWAEAEQAYRQAVAGAAAAGNRQVAARANRELGILLTETRSFDEAMDRLNAAAREFTALGDTAGVAWTLDRLAFAQWEHGDYPAALAVARRQLDAQRQTGDLAGMSAALDNMGLVRWKTGDYAEAGDLLRRSYELAERSGNVPVLVHAANDLAGLYAQRGDHRRAVEYLERAVTAAQRIGYRQAIAVLTSNAGELYREQGEYAEATRCYAAALRAALELGDWLVTVHCLAGLATTAADRNDPDAERLLARAIDVAGSLHRSYIFADLLYQRARLVARTDRLLEAERLCARAEEAATRLGQRALQLRIQLLRLRLAVALRRRHPGAAVAEIVAMLGDWTDPPEQALLHDAIVQIDPDATPSRERAAAFYRQLHERAPTVEYAAAYQRLTGESLPTRVPLPPLGAALAPASTDLDALLSHIERSLPAASLSPDDLPRGASAEDAHGRGGHEPRAVDQA